MLADSRIFRLSLPTQSSLTICRMSSTTAWGPRPLALPPTAYLPLRCAGSRFYCLLFLTVLSHRRPVAVAPLSRHMALSRNNGVKETCAVMLPPSHLFAQRSEGRSFSSPYPLLPFSPFTIPLSPRRQLPLHKGAFPHSLRFFLILYAFSPVDPFSTGRRSRGFHRYTKKPPPPVISAGGGLGQAFQGDGGGDTKRETVCQ